MILFDDDFRIDFVDWSVALKDPKARPAGRLGLMRLPGLDPAELGREVRVIRLEGTTLVVSLLLMRELGFLPSLVEEETGLLPTLRRLGVRHVHLPIPNLGVPESLPDLAHLVEEIVSSLRSGETVAMHCLAGLGRTGLVAACCLVRLGLPPAVAIVEVRTARPGSIETFEQEDYVALYAAYAAEVASLVPVSSGRA